MILSNNAYLVFEVFEYAAIFFILDLKFVFNEWMYYIDLKLKNITYNCKKFRDL